jgi:hypothetical protein
MLVSRIAHSKKPGTLPPQGPRLFKVQLFTYLELLPEFEPLELLPVPELIPLEPEVPPIEPDVSLDVPLVE